MIETLTGLAYEKKAPIWKDLAKRLSKGSRRMPSVNVGSIGRNSKPEDQVVVPGRVLGLGHLDHPVLVAGVGFSARAKEKIKRAGGECIDLMELANRNPKGSNVRIIV